MKQEHVCQDTFHSLGLLMLRVAAGSFSLFGHGLPKLLNVYSKWNVFPDPLGLGHGITLMIAIFAEVLCSAALILGWKVRWAAVPLVMTMLVAGLVVNAGQAWAEQELALMYAIPFCALIIAGGGRYTIERALQRSGYAQQPSDEIRQSRRQSADTEHAKTA
jgi:putative oxidoreductase